MRLFSHAMELEEWGIGKDMLRYAIVGPFHEIGLDIGSMADVWPTPALGAVFTPRRK